MSDSPFDDAAKHSLPDALPTELHEVWQLSISDNPAASRDRAVRNLYGAVSGAELAAKGSEIMLRHLSRDGEELGDPEIQLHEPAPDKEAAVRAAKRELEQHGNPSR